jgi:hypothetical protein
VPEPLNEADHDAYWRPLGQLLVQRGLLTNDELEAALDEQERTGDLLGEVLLRNGLLSKLALASSLHEQSLADEHESGFGSGLRSALGGAESQEPGVRRHEPETEGGFGSGLRRALEQHDEAG